MSNRITGMTTSGNARISGSSRDQYRGVMAGRQQLLTA